MNVHDALAVWDAMVSVCDNEGIGPGLKETNEAREAIAAMVAPGQVWTRCNESLPPYKPDTLQEWRWESAWVLVRDAGMDVHLAMLTQYPPEDGEAPEYQPKPQWILKGCDGMDIDDVIEWREIPA